MSQLGHLLELMYSAHLRVTSVRTVMREWFDAGLWRYSALRWAERDPRASRIVLTSGEREEPGE